MYRATVDHTSAAGTEPGTGGTWTTKWEVFLGDVLVDDVSNAQLSEVPTATIKGRTTGGTGGVSGEFAMVASSTRTATIDNFFVFEETDNCIPFSATAWDYYAIPENGSLEGPISGPVTVTVI